MGESVSCNDQVNEKTRASLLAFRCNASGQCGQPHARQCTAACIVTYTPVPQAFATAASTLHVIEGAEVLRRETRPNAFMVPTIRGPSLPTMVSQGTRHGA